MYDTHNLKLDGWNENINSIYKKVDMYVNNYVDYDDMLCTT